MDLLREFGVASCVADSAGRFPVITDLTSDFVYVRLHGATELYTSGYSPRELRVWAARARSWVKGGSGAARDLLAPNTGHGIARDVYIYFDNDVKVHAPFDAENLERLLKGRAVKHAPRSLGDVTEEPRTAWPAWRPRA